MRNSLLLLLFLCISVPVTAQVSDAQKLVIMVTDDWKSNTGTLYLFEKDRDEWKRTRITIPVSIGENGLGWGIGVHPEQQGEFVKHEGDRRSPAGVFELEPVVYGLDSTAPEGVRLPYRPLTDLSVCVDDTASVNYNRVFETDSSRIDWKSAEHMKRVDPDYKYVLVVKHNPQREKGKGSCIFLHINRMPTSGCTSMDEADMVQLLRWMDPARKTLLIQLPHSEYHRLRSAWHLPTLLNN